jgi:aryl-alcohol dehydrogenase-like predicted oxidoreductase
VTDPEERNADSFKDLIGLRDQLKVSRFSASTLGGFDTVYDDFNQYNALKLAVLDGGVNHIETSHMHRKQRSERVVGAVLQTLK